MNLLGNSRIYHGSHRTVEEPKILYNKFTKDFGSGFYVTKLKKQAIKWARRNTTAFVNTYDLVADNSLKIKKFDEINLEWLHFILDCRLGKSHDYDIVEGPVVDYQVYDWVQAYELSKITGEQFLIMCKSKYPINQICLCTEKAINCLKFIRVDEV